MRQIDIRLPALHEAQVTIKREARRYNVPCCGRRFGKTLFCNELKLDKLLEGEPIAYMTPTYKMLEDVWRSDKELLGPIIREKSEQERRIETVTGGVLDMWSLDNPDAIRGRRYKRVIIDEAASVKNLEEIWNQIVRPTLIDPGMYGDAWFPSTPKGMNGYYKLHLLGRDAENTEWKSWHFTSYDNPFLDPLELDVMRATMTERDYKQEILAEFLEGEGVVFRNIEACMKAPVTSPEEHREHVVVVGVDWGRDLDFTAISVGCVNCKRELFLDRFNQIDYAFQRQRLMGLMRRWNVKKTIVEANSIGTPILEQLQRDGVGVVGFQTTNASKAAVIEALSLALEQGSVQFLRDHSAMAELEAFERTTTETGLSKYSAPSGMHDDTVIARALMLKAMGQSYVPKVLDNKRMYALGQFFNQRR